MIIAKAYKQRIHEAARQYMAGLLKFVQVEFPQAVIIGNEITLPYCSDDDWAKLKELVKRYEGMNR